MLTLTEAAKQPKPSLADPGKCSECGYVGWRWNWKRRKLCRACVRVMQSP